jgi:hypothetical protein
VSYGENFRFAIAVFYPRLVKGEIRMNFPLAKRRLSGVPRRRTNVLIEGTRVDSIYLSIDKNKSTRAGK